ncbi:uncharacterized protein LOC124370985 [Homalodisca vitripennis]|uniref:uncharacterized protein LOC124370985 n=1 Tax=Homalodisca vitripennis TaxID=197043 RepID=UPI001EECCE74|nr:uncharacterized protein LOC124370985 [Homalodisca vitripennis]
MDVESFVLSVRSRESIWNQQLANHHNRYVLDKLWKEVGQENNCSVKDAQQKWKSLRDYYRKEIRKMQEERSGSSADTIYKSNWPYFMLLDFLRSQFKTRPTSGNLKEKIKPNKCLDSAATEGVPMASDENFDFENSQIEESYASNQPPNDTEATEMRN